MYMPYAVLHCSFCKACVAGECNKPDQNSQVAIERSILWLAGVSVVLGMVRVGEEFLYPCLVRPLRVEAMPLGVEHCFGSIACT